MNRINRHCTAGKSPREIAQGVARSRREFLHEAVGVCAAAPPDNPTVFEYFGKELKRPAMDAWVVAPSNGFNRIGESGNRAYGTGRAPV